MFIIKPIAVEADVTESSLGNARYVRVVVGAAAVLATIKDGTTTVSSLTLPANSVTILEKNPTDVLEFSASVKAVAVAYR